MILLCVRCGARFEPFNEAFPECPDCHRKGPFQVHEDDPVAVVEVVGP